MDSNNKLYPLVFVFPESVVGNGFIARVEIHGRVLLVEEADGASWLYGVQPGAITGGGANYSEACHEFRKACALVLFDIAAEADTADKFAEQVQSIFGTVNEPNQADWNAALLEVRKNSTALAGLNTVKAESIPPKVMVTILPIAATANDYIDSSIAVAVRAVAA